jgi:hypothetical protein
LAPTRTAVCAPTRASSRRRRGAPTASARAALTLPDRAARGSSRITIAGVAVRSEASACRRATGPARRGVMVAEVVTRTLDMRVVDGGRAIA